ncbi:MAG: DUF3791 domain-containing protein [Defluviitaleaceae bacterium]|nr:DUF3791 domain-containing protein [Defluviitaleaceae bacterium]
MSRLSFKTFCIEKYADHKSIPGTQKKSADFSAPVKNSD